MSNKVTTRTAKVAALLLEQLIETAGGEAAIANSLGWDRQYVHMQIKRGYVPLKRVYQVATLIECSPWALSYVKLVEAFGHSQSPILETVIRETWLSKLQKESLAVALAG